MYINRRNFCGMVALSASLLAMGCGSSGNSNVRTVNTSVGLTGYSVQVGVTGVAFSLPYGTEGVQQPGQYASTDASGKYRPIGAGTNQSVVLYQKVGTNLATKTQSFLKGGYYTVVNLNPPPGILLLVLTDNDSAPTSGNFKLRVVHSSPSAGSVDVYVTAPGGSVVGATPLLSNLQFGQVTQTYFQLAPGTYEVQVTPHGNPSSVVITKTFTPTAGNIYTAFTLDPAPGTSDFGLLITNDPVSKTTVMASGTTVP